MRWREAAAELWGDLRAQRVRAALSLLSIAWGTVSLLLLMAFSFGFEELFAVRGRGMGDAVAVGWPQRTTKPWQGQPSGRRLVVDRDDVLALSALVPELDAVSAEFMTAANARVGATVLRVPISGVDPAFAQLRALVPQVGGRFFGDADVRARRRVVFLGDRLAQGLFGTGDPVGRTLPLRGVPFLVIGVLEPKAQDGDYGGLDSGRAWVPATTFETVFGARAIDNLVFRARDVRRQAEASRAVVAALARRLAFDPTDRDALSVWDTTEQQRMMFFIFLGFHVMLGLSGTFTMLVGGIGIANLMSLLVRRRTPEIGLKLAVGATRAQVLREWLLQALVLVGAGGLLGSGVAVAIIVAVAHSPLTADVGVPHLPLPLVVGTVSLLAVVGLLAGLGPARRAARMHPVAALRGGGG
jgi:putative ABC transport system permease protein